MILVSDQLKALREKIVNACIHAGRKTEEVELIGVTKFVPKTLVLEAIAAGVKKIGESRVQESIEKYAAIHETCPNIEWHMIGGLQRNKASRAIEIFDLIQSLDSLKLAAALDRHAHELGKIQECLVELKVSTEQSKSGVSPAELENFLSALEIFKNLRVCGLMLMAPYAPNPDNARPYFAQGRKIFERHLIPKCKTANMVPILSMGMSNDFEAAIEEGSTMVRIGTALFGARNL